VRNFPAGKDVSRGHCYDPSPENNYLYIWLYGLLLAACQLPMSCCLKCSLSWLNLTNICPPLSTISSTLYMHDVSMMTLDERFITLFQLLRYTCINNYLTHPDRVCFHTFAISNITMQKFKFFKLHNLWRIFCTAVHVAYDCKCIKHNSSTGRLQQKHMYWIFDITYIARIFWRVHDKILYVICKELRKLLHLVVWEVTLFCLCIVVCCL
jgi:hypothetical protein